MQDQQALIEALLPYFQSPQFDKLFNQWTEELSRNEKFLLKMELNRLNSPCERLIDLRPRVNVPCHAFNYMGRTHYLDDLAIEVFEQQCQAYNERYTFGVYEAVTDFARYRQQEDNQQAQEQDPLASQPKISQVNLASQNSRSSERSFVSLEVRVELVTGRRASGTVIDISAGGARVRLPSYLELIPDEKIQLHFTQWDQQIPFAVVGSEKKGTDQQVRLRCLSDDRKYRQRVELALKQGRGKQRLDMELASQICLKHALQHASLKNLPHVPLFVSQSAQGPVLRYLLKTKCNQALLNQWQWEGALQLCRLLPAKRLQHLLRDQVVEDLLLCFQLERQGQKHTYAALHSELEQTGLLDLFIAFGSQQARWQILQVHATPLDPALAERPSPSPQLPEQGFDVPAELAPEIAKLTHQIQLSALPQSQCDRYRNQLKISTSPNALSAYWLKPQPDTLEQVNYDFLNLRQEPRYLHRSRISIRQPDGTAVSGVIRNFSTKGMQLELIQPLICEVSQQVQLSLVELQQISKRHRLEDLPYIVRAINSDSTVLRLSINEQVSPHPGEQFFAELTERNRKKLRALPPIHRLPPLAQALANLYASSFGHLILLLIRQGNSLVLRHLANCGQMPSSLEPLIKHPKGDFVRPTWLGANLLQNHLLPAWRSLKVGKRVQELYLDDLLTGADLQLTVTEPAEERLDMLADELAFISGQARHRARELENLLDSLALVVDVLPNALEQKLRQQVLPASGQSAQDEDDFLDQEKDIGAA